MHMLSLDISLLILINVLHTVCGQTAVRKKGLSLLFLFAFSLYTNRCKQQKIHFHTCVGCEQITENSLYVRMCVGAATTEELLEKTH